MFCTRRTVPGARTCALQEVTWHQMYCELAPSDSVTETTGMGYQAHNNQSMHGLDYLLRQTPSIC